jgi:hypothetical protein
MVGEPRDFSLRRGAVAVEDLAMQRECVPLAGTAFGARPSSRIDAKRRRFVDDQQSARRWDVDTHSGPVRLRPPPTVPKTAPWAQTVGTRKRAASRHGAIMSRASISVALGDYRVALKARYSLSRPSADDNSKRESLFRMLTVIGRFSSQ